MMHSLERHNLVVLGLFKFVFVFCSCFVGLQQMQLFATIGGKPQEDLVRKMCRDGTPKAQSEEELHVGRSNM